MKKIQLSGKNGKGKVTLVDDSDYEWLNQYKWYLGKYKTGFQIKRATPTKLLMHRLIMNAPKGMEVDHINFNQLDNQRHNLRLATSSQNHMHKLKLKNYNGIRCTSIYKGVYWDIQVNKWKAIITRDGEHLNLGFFPKEYLAAMAYDLNAITLHGEFAITNFQNLSSY
jgi:hypothetical protein